MAKPCVPYKGPIVTRAEALRLGLKRYFMGPDKPCRRRGHISERTTVDGGCIQCARTASMTQEEIDRKRGYSLKYDKQHRAEKNAKTQARYARMKAELGVEGLRAKWRAYYAAHTETAKGTTIRWQKRNAELLKAKRVANRDKLAAYSKAYKKAHPEKGRASAQRYREAHPERVLAYREANKEKLAQSSKAWKLANPDKVRANVRKWHSAHPGVVTRWRKANPEAWRAQTQARRARMANAEGKHTAAELAELLKKQGGRCIYCRKSIKTTYTVDHIQPLSRGGTNWITNIQLLCGPCNYSKQDADPIEFARRNGKLF